MKKKPTKSTQSDDLVPEYYDGNGMLSVNLEIDGRLQKCFVHELVCAAFHGPKPTAHSVCIIIDQTLRPIPENVCWVTQSPEYSSKSFNEWARLNAEKVPTIGDGPPC